MTFVIVEPGKWQSPDPLPKGWASLAKSGRLRLYASDLQAAGIKDRAVLLSDRDTWRIALRAARDDERERSKPIAICTTGKTKRDTGRRQLMIARAVRTLGLEVEKCSGRFELMRKGTGADALLIITLMPDTGAIGTKAKAKGGGK